MADIPSEYEAQVDSAREYEIEQKRKAELAAKEAASKNKLSGGTLLLGAIVLWALLGGAKGDD